MIVVRGTTDENPCSNRAPSGASSLKCGALQPEGQARVSGRSNPSLSAIIKEPATRAGFLMIVVRGITDENPGSN